MSTELLRIETSSTKDFSTIFINGDGAQSFHDFLNDQKVEVTDIVVLDVPPVRLVRNAEGQVIASRSTPDHHFKAKGSMKVLESKVSEWLNEEIIPES